MMFGMLVGASAKSSLTPGIIHDPSGERPPSSILLHDLSRQWVDGFEKFQRLNVLGR